MVSHSIEEAPLRFSADKYETNLKTRIIKAQGSVKVRFDNYDVSGSDMDYNPATGLVHVEGGFSVEHPKFTIVGQSLLYDLNKNTGTFYEARLKHSKGVIISAAELKVLGDNNFQLYQGSITSCEDCPAAWSFVGAYIDLTIEGYAEIHHALLQIKELPIFYFPFLILPVKLKRQSGLLFPNYGYSSKLGPQFAQSYYWAPREDFDSTFEYRYFSKAGSRLSSETRYRYSDRSFIDLDLSYVKNNDLKDVGENRYGIHVDERYQINPRWTQRWKGEWTSDPRYVHQFETGYDSYQLPIVSNDPSLSWQSDENIFVSRASFHQDNLQREVSASSLRSGLGPIDVFPHLIYSQPTAPIFGKIYAGWDIEWLSLRRNRDVPDLNTGWIRTGDRATADLRLETSISPGRVVSWDPKIEVRTDFYRLDVRPGEESTASRAHIFTQQALSSEFYHVYDSDLGNLKALRHGITPSLRWSYSPRDWTSGHAFFFQDSDFGGTRGTLESPRFDLFDPRPKDFVSDAVFSTADDESRLQEHSLLTFGLASSLVGRFGEETKRYEKLLKVNLAQDFDLFSQSVGLLRLNTFLGYASFSSNLEWIYDTNSTNPSNKTSTRLSAAYDNRNWKIEASHRKSKSIDSLSGTLSTKDLYGFSALASTTYDLRAEVDQIVRQRLQLGYKSDSKCWFFSLDVQRSPDLDKQGRDSWNFSPNIGISISNDALDLPGT